LDLYLNKFKELEVVLLVAIKRDESLICKIVNSC